jgi:hypothetical protein
VPKPEAIQCWGSNHRGAYDSPRETPPVGRLALEGFHAEVIKAASDLFADGHYSSAVYKAFKSVEVRVRRLTGIDKSGAQLMGDAFGGKAPHLILAVEPGRSGADEQDGGSPPYFA